MKSANVTTLVKFEGVANQKNALEKTIQEKESMILVLKEQLADTKQLVMDGMETYFAKKNGEVIPAE